MNTDTTRRALITTAVATVPAALAAVPALAGAPDPDQDLAALYADLMEMAERIHATGATFRPMRRRLTDSDYWRTPENSGRPRPICDASNETASKWCRDGGLPEAWWRRLLALEARFMAIEPRTLRGAALQYSWTHEFNGVWSEEDQPARTRFRAFLHGGRGKA